MVPSKPNSNPFPQRPYLDPRIDRWKLFVLTLLFFILLIGALTWTNGTPWGGLI